MHRTHILLLTSPVILFSAISLPREALGQGLFDQLGRQVERQFRQEVQRAIPRIVPPQFQPPGLQPPGFSQPPQSGDPRRDQPRSLNALPNEGGKQNNPNAFDSSKFFAPPGGGSPSYSQPQYQSTPYPNPYYQNPASGQPIQGQPLYGSSGSGSNGVSEPPVARGDYSGKMIKVRCPRDQVEAINYKLVLARGEFPYTMRPGESQSFKEDRLWLIRFMSGSEEITYRLRGGNTYTFSRGASGRTQLFKDEAPKAEIYREPPTRSSK